MAINEKKLFCSFKELTYRKMDKIFLIIVHHRGGNGTADSIHQQHLKQGWAGIGYHYYIQKDGTVWSCRPINTVGAHCSGNNTSSIGICFEGNFKYDKPTKEQLQAGKELILRLRAKIPSIKRVLNHNDLYKTECPVINLKELLKWQ